MKCMATQSKSKRLLFAIDCAITFSKAKLCYTQTLT